jgi:putative membrane protein
MLHVVESPNPLDQVAKDLEAAVARHKFGALSVHDLKGKMAEKGVPFAREYRIFESGGLNGMVALPITAWAQERTWEWGWHPMWGMWGAWGLGMMAFMLAFWVLVIAGLVLGIRWLVAQGRESRSDSALEILRQRYARGEINKEEFEAKKRDLT